MSEKEIILIGPIGAGKSTIAELLSKRLNLPHCPMDEYRWEYYDEIGYDHLFVKELKKKEGINGVCRYWKKFEIHAVERLLSEHRNSIIDFGAGHSVYENKGYLERAKQALKPFKNVILLLPSPNKEYSKKVLKDRNNFDSEDTDNLNKHFIEHLSNYELAKHVIYTDGVKPENSVIEILKRISHKSITL